MLVAAVACAAGFSPGALGDTITLKRAVRMPVDRDYLILRDIASLSGADAEGLGEVIVLRSDDPTALREIALTTIREALEDAGAHWGHVHLTGRDVIVRPRSGGGVRAPQAMKPAAIASDIRAPAAPRSADEREVFQIATNLQRKGTVRGAVVERIVYELHRAPSEIHLRFDPASRALLDQSLRGQQIEIDPLSQFNSDRLELTIRLWRNGRVVQSGSVTAFLELRVHEARLARELRRGDAIAAADLTVTRQWLAPSAARLVATPESLLGRRAARRLKAGEIVRQRDTEAEVIIQRGDPVTVRCLSGGIVITFVAEARSDAAVNELVELRRRGEREVFTAVAARHGEAILDLSDPSK